jgi:hypothetical protein
MGSDLAGVVLWRYSLRFEVCSMGRNGFGKTRRKKVTAKEDESSGMQTNTLMNKLRLKGPFGPCMFQIFLF